MDARDLEIISAFADGESVATEHLVEALEQPEGHAALLDFLRLRETVERDARRPSPEIVVELGERLEKPVPWWRRAVLLPAAVPAGLALLAAVALSLWLNVRSVPPVPADAPPVPDRVLVFENGVDWHLE